MGCVLGIYHRLCLLKKMEPLFLLVVIRCTFEIRYRNQPRIALEWHQENEENDFSHITWSIFSYKRVVVNAANHDNYFLINSYLAFDFLLFAFPYDNLLAIRCISWFILLSLTDSEQTIPNLLFFVYSNQTPVPPWSVGIKYWKNPEFPYDKIMWMNFISTWLRYLFASRVF